MESEPEEVERVRKPLVFFDLETTGLDKNCEIVQLAAVSGDHSLNLYVVPRCPIQRGASKVTGFCVHRRRLYRHQQPVLANTLREVLVSFLAFLRMLRRPLVVGHNIRRFDCPRLARALDELDLRAEFESRVSGYVDTLPLFRELLKDRRLQSFRQESLVRELLGLDYRAHDALEDVRALQALYSVLRPSAEAVHRHWFTLDTMNTPATQELPVSNNPTKMKILDEFCRETGQIDTDECPSTLKPHPVWQSSTS